MPVAPSLVTPHSSSTRSPATRARTNSGRQWAGASSPSATPGGHTTPDTLSQSSSTTRVVPPCSRRPPAVGSKLPGGRHAGEVAPHRLPRVVPRRIQPPLHRARAQRAPRRLGRDWIERPPQPPPLLASQPRAHHCGGAADRGPQMLPVVDRAAVPLPGVPTAPHQQRRLFRIRPTTAVAPMPLDAHPLAPLQKPRGPPVAPVLPRERGPAMRAAPPLPGRPACQLPQPLEEGLTPFDNVHGRGHHSGVSTCYGGTAPPWFTTPAALLPTERRPTHFQHRVAAGAPAGQARAILDAPGRSRWPMRPARSQSPPASHTSADVSRPRSTRP